MSSFTEEQAKNLKNKAVSITENYLSDLLISDTNKCAKLSYWINDYINFQKQECKFNSRKLIRYERGSIVKVHLGFKIGHEEGGLHYCIVLDKNNALNSDVLTVIPLTSKKKTNNEIHPNDIDLENDIYQMLNLKLKTIAQENNASLVEMKSQIENLKNMLELCKRKFQNVSGNDNSDEEDEFKQMIENFDNLISKYDKKVEVYKNKRKIISKTLNEIKKMKNGSIALVNQITTISKQRIYDPKNTSGIFYGVKLNSERLDRIDEQLVKLYIKN